MLFIPRGQLVGLSGTFEPVAATDALQGADSRQVIYSPVGIGIIGATGSEICFYSLSPPRAPGRPLYPDPVPPSLQKAIFHALQVAPPPRAERLVATLDGATC